MTKPSKQDVQDAIEFADDSLPDGAYWMVIHDALGLDYGDLFPLMEEYGLFDAPPEAK